MASKIPLDRHLDYLSQLGISAVKFNSNITGRPIVYCSLKRTSAVNSDNGKTIQINEAESTRKENESLKKYLDRRNTIKPNKAIVKELFPETAHLEPASSISSYLDSLSGMERIEIKEDYSYYRLNCSILKSNQVTNIFSFDPTMQIILPRVKEIEYKKNDKIMFDYEDKEYIYTVSDPPEFYLKDVFQLNLKALYTRLISK